jgi:hypothetical protein
MAESTESTLDRRWLLRSAGAAGAAMVGGLALTSSAQADDGHGGVEGSWMITHRDDPGGDPTEVKGVVSFAAGGALLNVDIAPPGPAAAGAWEETGSGAFKATFWIGFPGMAPDQPAVTVRVRPRGKVDDDKISGTYTFTGWNAATGESMQSGTGMFWGERIEA